MLDTNMCIYLMKHQPPQVRERFAACFVGDVVISAVTLAELEFGIACSSPAVQDANRSALDSVLEDIRVAPFDTHAARAYGPIRAAYKDRKRDALDKLIASHAVALGVTLVTNNEADFVNYPGLRVENWVSNR
jgi:tRNA(fMet)-specific endonuclease VapC